MTLLFSQRTRPATNRQIPPPALGFVCSLPTSLSPRPSAPHPSLGEDALLHGPSVFPQEFPNALLRTCPAPHFAPPWLWRECTIPGSQGETCTSPRRTAVSYGVGTPRPKDHSGAQSPARAWRRRPPAPRSALHSTAGGSSASWSPRAQPGELEPGHCAAALPHVDSSLPATRGQGWGGRAQLFQFAFPSLNRPACPTVCRVPCEARVYGGLRLCPAGAHSIPEMCINGGY